MPTMRFSDSGNNVQAAATQRGVDGVLVDDGLARKVDENRARLEESQLVSADHAHGVGLGRHVQGQVVAVAAEVLEGAHALHALGERPGVLNGDERIIAKDVHAQIDAGVCHLGANVAKAHHADALALELVADEGLLGLLGVDEDVRVVCVGTNPLHGLHHAATGEDEHRDDDLLDRVGVGARGVEDHDAPARVLLHRDIVDAGAAAGDSTDGGRQLVAVEVGGAHQDGVGLGGLGHNLVALAKLYLAVLGDVIDGLDAAHALLPWLFAGCGLAFRPA